VDRAVSRQRLAGCSCVLALGMGLAACSQEALPAPKQPAPVTAPASEPPAHSPAPRVDLPEPARSAEAEPLVVAGRVVRPDGSPLERVQVALWASDAAGQLAEVLAHAETETNGKFELPFAEIPRVSRVRFRWQPMRQPPWMYDVIPPAIPLGPPVDVWLDCAEIADWTSIKATVDTGWTLTGQVRSERGRGLGEVRVTNTIDGRLENLDWGARFAFPDIPWAIETCSLEVTDDWKPVAKIEVARPPPGSRETFTEIALP
jgi:hypothetical protein